MDKIKSPMLVRLTREELKDRMRFDTKEDIAFFKSVCEEILNETCGWKSENKCNFFKDHITKRVIPSCKKEKEFIYQAYTLDTLDDFKFCPYCGKEIKEIEL